MSRSTPVAAILALSLSSAAALAAADQEASAWGDRWGFGAALSVTADYGEHDRIDEAELVDGIIRVSKERNVIGRIMLETHYLFAPKSRNFAGRFASELDYGWGYFVAVEPGGDGDLVDALGIGVLWSFRKGMWLEKEPTAEKPASTGKAFNLGFGVVVDPQVRVLGDGLEVNKPLPGGETEIRYKETDQWGILVLFSVSI